MKLQVTNVSTPINSTQVIVTFQEYDDKDPKNVVTGSTSLSLSLDPKDAAMYTGGSVYNLKLEKANANAS